MSDLIKWHCIFVSFRSPSLFYLLVHSRCPGYLFSLDHTQAHTTVGRTPLDEGSARRRDLYVTTQTLYKTNIHAPGGIRTHDPSKRLAADLHLIPRGHWDRHTAYYAVQIQGVSTVVVQEPSNKKTFLACSLLYHNNKSAWVPKRQYLSINMQGVHPKRNNHNVHNIRSSNFTRNFL
jgi:hypothetical protein